MNTLQYMRAFVSVAETGSFTIAAEHLESTTANVSRSIGKLETHLRTRLFNRTTRRIALTEAGRRYFARCIAALAAIDEAEAEARAHQQTPSGRLRVHSMAGIGTHYVIDAMAAYRERFPAVTFDLQLDNDIPDLIEDGFDLSIVLADHLEDSAYICQHIGMIYSVLCASPAYLARRGHPQTLADLSGHDCLVATIANAPQQWQFIGPDGPPDAIRSPVIRHIPFQANTMEAMRVAVTSGMGIGVIPSYSAIAGLRSGALQRVLPSYRVQALNLYALYPSRLYLDAKIKTWLEHLRTTLPQALDAEERDLNAASA